MFYSMPSGGTGYYRGSPGHMGNQDSSMGGSNVSAKGFLTGNGTGTGWTPTILYLFVLILAEMFLFGWLSRKV